ncbi:MAG: helicase-related protein, partial [Pseudomonadota bacterium]
MNAFYNGVLNASNSIDGVDNPKIKYIINTIEAKSTEKFIVYSALMDAGVNILKEALREASIKAVYITGEQTIANKENAKKYFNGYDFKNPNFFNKSQIDDKNLKYINSDYRVLIITKAGAEGVDTVNCNNIILLDGQWNNAFTEQIVARAIRFKSHFGLPVPQRFVNVIRPLLIKPG